MSPPLVRTTEHRAARGWTSALVSAVAAAAAAIAGCDRLQRQEPIPTYPDRKLEVMRDVTGASLPHDPHRAVPDAAAVPAAAASAATVARP